jgi:2-desacetyl-2-hydroxyethyl bacteriochlorophyllide A dehydrogenase
MRAISLNGPSLDQLVRTDLPDPPPPGPGQVLVRMKAASLNFIDLAVALGHYPGIAYPLVPLADGVGEILAVGAEASGLIPGDRVALHPKTRWIAGRGSAENARVIRGVTRPGALREIATADADAVVRLADHLSWESAATLPIAATTAWNALTAADAGPSSTVVLLGTGSVSLLALQLAKARGARVIITSSSDAKLERTRTLGADATVNYRTSPDWEREVLRLTDGRGADLVLDTVGSQSFVQSLASACHGGLVFTIGFVTGTTLQLDLMPIIVKSLRVQGNNTGSVENFADAMKAIGATRLEPLIDRTFGVGEVADAYRRQSSWEGFGKIVVRLDW